MKVKLHGFAAVPARRSALRHAGVASFDTVFREAKPGTVPQMGLVRG